MLTCSLFFHSVEFYVILTVLTALIVGFCAMPSSRGEVQQHLVAGEIFACEGGEGQSPSVEFLCREDGTVVLWRRGLKGIYSSGAVSLAIEVKGFDVSIEERLTPGQWSRDDMAVTDATFTLKFMGHEHYHIRYNSDDTGLSATCTLHNRGGIVLRRDLHQ